MPQPLITSPSTPRLGLPYLFPGQAQKEAFVNEALARLDALVVPSVQGERADPPATPAVGDCYVVAATPAGAWEGHAGALAVWAENQWLFAEPVEGMWIFDRGAGGMAHYSDPSGWTRVAAPPLPGGGATQDAEARAAIGALIEGLRNLGIFA